MRTKPGSTLNVQFINKGSKISDQLVSRAPKPFIRADQNLNWTLADNMPVNAAKLHPGVLLRTLDFTSVFALPGEELFREVRGRLPGSDGGYWGEFFFYFTDKAIAMLNMTLESVGLPPVVAKYIIPSPQDGLYYCGRDMGEGSTFSYVKVKEFFQKPNAYSGVTWTDATKFTHCFTGDQYKLGLQLQPSPTLANALIIPQFNKL